MQNKYRTTFLLFIACYEQHKKVWKLERRGTFQLRMRETRLYFYEKQAWLLQRGKYFYKDKKKSLKSIQ